MTLHKAKDGRGNAIKLCGMDVYLARASLPSIEKLQLGASMDMYTFISRRVPKPESQQSVQNMLADWHLYENGWLVTTDESGEFRNKQLFFYKCQIGNCVDKPQALELLEFEF